MSGESCSARRRCVSCNVPQISPLFSPASACASLEKRALAAKDLIGECLTSRASCAGACPSFPDSLRSRRWRSCAQGAWSSSPAARSNLGTDTFSISTVDNHLVHLRLSPALSERNRLTTAFRLVLAIPHLIL